jgi:hypothetical protein
MEEALTVLYQPTLAWAVSVFRPTQSANSTRQKPFGYTMSLESHCTKLYLDGQSPTSRHMVMLHWNCTVYRTVYRTVYCTVYRTTVPYHQPTVAWESAELHRVSESHKNELMCFDTRVDLIRIVSTIACRTPLMQSQVTKS